MAYTPTMNFRGMGLAWRIALVGGVIVGAMGVFFAGGLVAVSMAGSADHGSGPAKTPTPNLPPVVSRPTSTTRTVQPTFTITPTPVPPQVGTTDDRPLTYQQPRLAAPAAPAPPAKQREVVPFPAPKPCPTGVVTAGLKSVTIQNEVPSPSGISTYMDIVGKGALTNESSDSVQISIISIPQVNGLDSQGNSVISASVGAFDYLPPPGQPRPSSIILAPGESVTYSFINKDEMSGRVSRVTHWYTDLKYLDAYAAQPQVNYLCKVPIVPNSLGQSLRNPYHSP